MDKLQIENGKVNHEKGELLADLGDALLRTERAESEKLSVESELRRSSVRIIELERDLSLARIRASGTDDSTSAVDEV